MKELKFLIIAILILVIILFTYKTSNRLIQENRFLKQAISKLKADSRVAEVLVTGVNFDEKSKKNLTTIKFLEYDTNGLPLPAKYFTFTGNIIQFQSLVVRFDDLHVTNGSKLKGRSAYLFWKVFMLDDTDTQIYEITKVNEVPLGYRLSTAKNKFEEELWRNFWKYALDPDKAEKLGIKNAQIEAPGTAFVPGTIYIIKIEHDGGMRIDAKPVPQILRGEKIL
ncbi:MAG: hypothetical protein AB1755_06060 [Candidatus Omnitrophota bacterium]